MSELEPPIKPRDLPRETLLARAEAARLYEAASAYWQPRIDAHLDVYEHVVGTLIEHHAQFADGTDLEIGADTRWSAMWEMSGRCLAIARVLLHDGRGGFCSEADGTLRALHEAVQLLGALAFHGEEKAVRTWLAGEWVKPGQARAVQGRQQQLAIQRMRDSGLEPEFGDVAKLGEQIYGLMSKSAHHRRGGFPESFSPELRQFAYGPHPNPERRASHLNFVGELLEEVVITVGAALGDLFGGDYRARTVRPLQDAMHRIREEAPLPD